jgi:hypothetical protein
MATLSAPSDVFISRAKAAYGASDCPEKEHFQPFEMLRAAVLHELVPQFLNDSIEYRKRPTPFEDTLGRLIVRKLALVPLFTGREFKRHYRSGAAFCARAGGLLRRPRRISRKSK